MNKFIRISLICLICILALGMLFIGFGFTFGSWFMFAGDIDITDEQRRIALNKAALASFSGVIVMIISMGIMIFSGVISRFILKLFGIKFNE